MYAHFCHHQDFIIKEIIGQGRKRGGLYYMDDVCFISVLTSQGFNLCQEVLELDVASSVWSCFFRLH
jgi:hypothetical protein